MENHNYNILFYILVSNNPIKGGIERVSAILAEEFIARGCKVYSLSNICDGVFGYDDAFVLPQPWQVSCQNREYIVKLVDELKIDYIIAANMSHPVMLGNLDGLHGRVKIICHYHSSPKQAYSRLSCLEKYSIQNYRWFQRIVFTVQRRLKAPVFGEMYEKSEKVVVLHKAFIPELKLFSHIDDSKISVITNPMSFKAIDCNLGSKEKVVLWVGRIKESEKRISSLLRIWKMASPLMPGWSLQILGGGEELDYWKSKASDMNLQNYEFLGFRAPMDYYRTASIYVMTSNIEGWGMTLLEAMSFSCAPILFNSYASASDIVDNGNSGILVKPFNDKVFADKLVDLASDDITRELLAGKAHEQSLRFSTETTVNHWFELFDELRS